jgi:hypothetical protein
MQAKSLGNTVALHAAKEALRTMAPALEAGRKKQSDAEVVEAKYNALLIYLEVSALHLKPHCQVAVNYDYMVGGQEHPDLQRQKHMSITDEMLGLQG